MKKIIVLGFALIFTVHLAKAQKYFTRTGSISFYSDAPMEKIEAHNQKATSVLDAKSGKMEFAVLIKAFQFEKALMQEHFNENYMESSKYPKATFKGEISNIADVDFGTDGTYAVQLKGDLNIHGEKQAIKTNGRIIIIDGAIKGQSEFEVTVADYKIKIPRVVRENIAKMVKISVDIKYEPLNKKVANK